MYLKYNFVKLNLFVADNEQYLWIKERFVDEAIHLSLFGRELVPAHYIVCLAMHSTQTQPNVAQAYSARHSSVYPHHWAD